MVCFYIEVNRKHMSKLFKRLALALCIVVASAHFSLAQGNSEEDSVRACLANYMSGDGPRVEKAFHPSAYMKYIDVQTGEFKDVPIADYIARVKTGKPSERKIGIESLNIEGNAAQAKIRIETGTVILNDYMNLLKVNGEWKIVSKIFSRKNK
jgi:hypothetical protein